MCSRTIGDIKDKRWHGSFISCILAGRLSLFQSAILSTHFPSIICWDVQLRPSLSYQVFNLLIMHLAVPVCVRTEGKVESLGEKGSVGQGYEND